MKTLQRIFLPLLTFAATCAGFTACSSDDSEPEKPAPTPQIQAAIKYTPSQDLLNTADIKLTYTDGYGTKHTDNVTGPYEKTISVSQLPARVGYEVSLTPKASYETKESYNISVISSINITNNGTPVTAHSNNVKSLGVHNLEGLYSGSKLNFSDYYDLNEKGELIQP